jgi:hypothetical protein
MLYRFAADIVFVSHLCFALFAVFGGLLVLRRRRILYFHLPALMWGVAVELLQLPCPLTRLENQLRALGGEAGYAGGFIEYLVSAILYAQISAATQIFLGVFLLVFNIFVYAAVFQRRRFLNSESAA